MKNIDKIRQMTTDELAYLLYSYTVDYETCSYCPIYHFCEKVRLGDCLKTHRQWLEQEVEEK